MASYLRSLVSYGLSALVATATTTTAETSSTPDIPTLTRESPPPDDDDDEGSDTETERDREDDDTPPVFPSLNSAQRVRQQPSRPATNVLPKILTDKELMPPPPPPTNRLNRLSAPARPTPGSLAVPLTTTKRPPKKSRLVALAPGHSTMDWANLKATGQDLRGVPNLMRITPSMLKQHNTRDDAWSSFNGKVYNMTPYLSFHPGGEKELMRVAGRDGTKLFALNHSWVSAEMTLDACLVGFLIPEPSS